MTSVYQHKTMFAVSVQYHLGLKEKYFVFPKPYCTSTLFSSTTGKPTAVRVRPLPTQEEEEEEEEATTGLEEEVETGEEATEASEEGEAPQAADPVTDMARGGGTTTGPGIRTLTTGEGEEGREVRLCC